MLFPTAEFIFGFLPLSLALFFLVSGTWGNLAGKVTLTLLSLAFYGTGEVSFVWTLLGSMLLNFAAGRVIARTRSQTLKSAAFWVGLIGNLGLLVVFKYMGFLAENLRLVGLDIPVPALALPLGISFYTFQQIAYLVDVRRGRETPPGFCSYATFITFFPGLIAGPIVYLREFAGQVNSRYFGHFSSRNFAIGLSIFAIGLFKKVVVADELALIANNAFAVTDSGGYLSITSAWAGAISYSLQLYFDFSGYSDMAIGLARMFNIRLPENFRSPYKATSIIEFWRRWHITLSRFLREYLYFSLGGNRKGPIRRHVNLFLTMLIGGLWHGAGWNFLFWGGLHGAFLIVNHGWRATRFAGTIPAWMAQALTLAVVVVAWVFFRSGTVEGASTMLGSMIGMANGAHIQVNLMELALLLAVTAGALFLPNTREIMSRYRPVYERGSFVTWPIATWRPNWTGAAFVGVLLVASLLNLTRVSEFIYFRF